MHVGTVLRWPRKGCQRLSGFQCSIFERIFCVPKPNVQFILSLSISVVSALALCADTCISQIVLWREKGLQLVKVQLILHIE